jgi:hypothetical protein
MAGTITAGSAGDHLPSAGKVVAAPPREAAFPAAEPHIQVDLPPEFEDAYALLASSHNESETIQSSCSTMKKLMDELLRLLWSKGPWWFGAQPRFAPTRLAWLEAWTLWLGELKSLLHCLERSLQFRSFLEASRSSPIPFPSPMSRI